MSDPPDLWRARSRTWSAEGDGGWCGRWRTKTAALVQAQRWGEACDDVWIESMDDRIQVLQGQAHEVERAAHPERS